MCGLCGIVGPNLGGAEWDLFKHLMIVSTLRGEDGAGLVAVPAKGGKDFEVLKSEGCAADLVTGHEFLSMRKDRWACFMGHARAPTAGSWTIEDVHPHVSGPIFGMHNGTLTRINGQKVPKDQSDSRMLFNSIRNQGIENTVQQMQGSYAISYLNKPTDQLCFIRNSERPLFFAQFAGLPFIIWASERHFIDLIANRTVGLADKALSIYRLAPDKFLTFRIHNTGTVKYVDFRTIEKATAGPPPEEPKTHTPDEKATQMWETVRGSYLTEDELKIALASGCANCSRGFDMTDFQRGKTLWFDKTEFMCDDCAEHDELARDYLKAHGVTPPHTYTTH